VAKVERRVEHSDHLGFDGTKCVPVVEGSDRDPEVLSDPCGYQAVAARLKLSII
jgi:hypothetical protein